MYQNDFKQCTCIQRKAPMTPQIQPTYLLPTYPPPQHQEAPCRPPSHPDPPLQSLNISSPSLPIKHEVSISTSRVKERSGETVCAIVRAKYQKSI